MCWKRLRHRRLTDGVGIGRGHSGVVDSPPSPRIAREVVTVQAMLRLYCRSRHHPASGLCGECGDLLAYAERRIASCPHGQDDKPSCGVCTIHCYDRANRERIRTVMRWAGPRMLLHHPWLALLHWLDRFRPGRKRSASS